MVSSQLPTCPQRLLPVFLFLRRRERKTCWFETTLLLLLSDLLIFDSSQDFLLTNSQNNRPLVLRLKSFPAFCGRCKTLCFYSINILMGGNLKEDETGGVSQRRGGTNSRSNCVNHVLVNKESFQKLQPYYFLLWPLAPKYSDASFFFLYQSGKQTGFH